MTSHDLTMRAIDGGILGDPFVMLTLIWIAICIVALWIDYATRPMNGD